MATVTELGQKVKMKYPGQYDDLDDTEVGRRVKAKYPGSYDDFTEVQAVTPVVETGLKTPGENRDKGILSASVNAVIGAAKGVADIPREFAQAGQKFGSFLAEKAFGKPSAPATGTLGALRQGLEKGTEQTALTTPTNAAQRFGFGAEKVAELFVPGMAPAKGAKAISAAAGLEKVPGLLGKGLRLAPRAATEAATVGGQTYVQTGGDAEQAATAAKLGAAVPVVGGVLKGVGRTLAAEPERLIGKALGFTKAQVSKLDKIASENGSYRGIKDFALKHGFGGSREQIAQQVEERFSELTRGSKPELLASITETTPNTYKSAFDHLLKVYDVPGQEKAANEILELAAKPELTGAELDKVRAYLDATLPQGAYKGAEPVKTEGLQNLIDPIRRRLEQIDPSGTIKRLNQDIRVLYPMMDAIAKSKSVGAEGAAAFRTLVRGGATQALTALGVPLPKIATIPYVIYQGATDFPQVASYVAQKLKGAEAAIPKDVPLLLQKALERWK